MAYYQRVTGKVAYNQGKKVPTFDLEFVTINI